MDRQQSVTVLGSTGSIGVNTLDVIARHPDRYSVFALTARNRTEQLLEQCRRFNPRVAVLAEEKAADRFRAMLRAEGLAIEVWAGTAGLEAVASHASVDCVMSAIVGFAGLAPTLAAVRAGKKVLLANKEALVCAGHLLMQAVKQSGASLLPIDSEHNAIFQCLPPGGSLAEAGVERLLLTASGGPFRDWTREAMRQVTPEQACAHPNWKMGQKISVDSATMMNKGLELIEACWLFDTTPAQVQVLVHPQSIVHSLVQFRDGTTLAQLGNPDMRTPIAYGLAWPQRIQSGVAPLDLVAAGSLSFQAPDETRFPALRLAREVFMAGGCQAVVMNAANEVAVEAFLSRRLAFTAIVELVGETVEKLAGLPAPLDVEGIYALDAEARARATAGVAQHG